MEINFLRNKTFWISSTEYGARLLANSAIYAPPRHLADRISVAYVVIDTLAWSQVANYDFKGCWDILLPAPHSVTRNRFQDKQSLRLEQSDFGTSRHIQGKASFEFLLFDLEDYHSLPLPSKRGATLCLFIIFS
ncbi:unnamed protein product [Clavelina lepadiformis]|uniref:Uncharacterized protein n=1 Tax=Clavelina lepadiformis TaxID=159417 RepID=A0ABP0EZM2_CLALP